MGSVLVPLKSMEVFPLDFCGENTIKSSVYIKLYSVLTVGGILSLLIPSHKEESWLMRGLT